MSIVPTSLAVPGTRSSARNTFSLIACLLCLQGCANHTVALWSENDAWVDVPEAISNYSNGLQLTFSPAAPHEPCANDCNGHAFRRFIDFMNIFEARDEATESEVRLRYGLSHQYFTPDNTQITVIQPEDRPYASWLSTSIEIVNERLVSDMSSNDRYARSSIGMRIGIVGPAAQGEELQSWWHRVCSCSDPQGWDLQLENEPGFVYTLNHERQLVRHDLSNSWSMDLIGTAEAAIGNVYTGAELAGTVRLGYNLSPRWQGKTMADIGYDVHDIGVSPGFFLMAGLTGRYVAQDIFVDGNTWRDSHSVNRTPWVSDQLLGLGMYWKQLELRATMIRRTDQYSTQSATTWFGSVVVVWRPSG